MNNWGELAQLVDIRLLVIVHCIPKKNTKTMFEFIDTINITGGYSTMNPQ